MNNRTQQRFDRSIREAVAHAKRVADERHAAIKAIVRASRARDVEVVTVKRPCIRLSEADKLLAYEAGVRHPRLS